MLLGLRSVLLEEIESLYVLVYVTRWMKRPNSLLGCLLLKTSKWKLRRLSKQRAWVKFEAAFIRLAGSGPDECQSCLSHMLLHGRLTRTLWGPHQYLITPLANAELVEVVFKWPKMYFSTWGQTWRLARVYNWETAQTTHPDCFQQHTVHRFSSLFQALAARTDRILKDWVNTETTRTLGRLWLQSHRGNSHNAWGTQISTLFGARREINSNKSEKVWQFIP